MSDPDAEDAARSARGDTAAFERIYRRHAARIHLMSRRFVGDAIADDAMQDVFVRAWQQLPQFRGESQFGTWLFRVATSVLLRHATTVRRLALKQGSADPDAIASLPHSTDAAIDVQQALLRLEEHVRAVVVLHDMEGFRHQEIAESLGISVSASKMRLHRGRMQLREWLA